MSRKCECCGKEIPETKGPGRPRKYCSIQCRRNMEFKKRIDKSIYSYEDWLIKYPKYSQEDYKLRYTDKDLSFTENDNNWGLGESNLTEHPLENQEHEMNYVKQELKRIFSRKPNP